MMSSSLLYTSGITNPYTKVCRITNPTRRDALKEFEKDDVLSGAMAGNYRVNPPRYNIDSKGGFRRGPIASFSFYNKPSAHSNYKKMYDYLKSGRMLYFSIKKGLKWTTSWY